MPEVQFEVDVDAPPDDQLGDKPFNRWHPEIESVVTAEPGETVRLECLDWTGGQIQERNSRSVFTRPSIEQLHYSADAGPTLIEPGGVTDCRGQHS